MRFTSVFLIRWPGLPEAFYELLTQSLLLLSGCPTYWVHRLVPGALAKTQEEEDIVSSQTPKPDEEVNKGTVVVLAITVPGIAVPDVRDKSRELATSTLSNAGFNVIEKSAGPARSADESRKVASQDPAPGVKVRLPGDVTILVRDEYKELDEEKWVLTETLLNPNGENLDPPPKITKDSDLDYKRTVNETSITTSGHFVDKTGALSGKIGDISNYTYRVDFDAPPKALVPGETITLNARVSGKGFAKYDSGEFVYGVVIGKQVIARTGYTIDKKMEPGNLTLSFTVPEKSNAELQIMAMFNWVPGAQVQWKYRVGR